MKWIEHKINTIYNSKQGTSNKLIGTSNKLIGECQLIPMHLFLVIVITLNNNNTNPITPL
jgi:hypothetical protein